MRQFEYDEGWYIRAIEKLRKMEIRERDRMIARLPNESRRKTVSSDIEGKLEERRNKINTSLINDVCNIVFGTDIDGNIYKLILAQTTQSESTQDELSTITGEYLYAFLAKTIHGEIKIVKHYLSIWRDDVGIFRFSSNKYNDDEIHHSGFVIKIDGRVYCLGIGPHHIRPLIFRFYSNMRNGHSTGIFVSYTYNASDPDDTDIVSKRVIIYSLKNPMTDEFINDVSYVKKQISNIRDYESSIFA